MSNQIKPNNVFEQDPHDPDFFSDPYSRYSQWHDLAAPIFWKGYDFWCLLDYNAVNRVLRDRRFARLAPPEVPQQAAPVHLQDFAIAEKYSLLCMEPPDHTRLRKQVNRAFVSHQVGRLTPTITAMAHDCIDGFESQNRVELLQCYATPIPLNVITQLLGVPSSAGAQLVAWSHAMVRVYTLTQTHEEEVLANKAATEFRKFLQEVLREKQLHPGDDLLSQLLAIRGADQTMSEEEIISVTILLLNAGHEATVHQLGNAIYILLQQYSGSQRALLNSALKDDAKAEEIVAECLRYAPPLHMFTRYAQEHLTLEGGIELAPGDQVALLLAAANRCPQQFAQPNQFIPGRADAAHLALGAGIHYCVGAQLSKLELRIALQVLFQRLPNLELMDKPSYLDAYHFHGLEELHVRW